MHSLKNDRPGIKIMLILMRKNQQFFSIQRRFQVRYDFIISLLILFGFTDTFSFLKQYLCLKVRFYTLRQKGKQTYSLGSWIRPCISWTSQVEKNTGGGNEHSNSGIRRLTKVINCKNIVFQDICVYLIYVVIVLIVSFGNRDINSFYMKVNLSF